MTIFHFDTRILGLVTAVFCSFSTLAQSAGAESAIPVPSGQQLSFLQFISERDGDVARFRFLAPQIGAEFDYMTVFADFQALCDEQVLPVLSQNEMTPSRIVLSMSAQDVPFGEPAPDVLQFFEIFSIQDSLCMWEEF